MAIQLTVELIAQIIEGVQESAEIEQSDWDEELAMLYTIKVHLKKGEPLTQRQLDFALSFL